MNFPLIANVVVFAVLLFALGQTCLLYTSPSPRDA